MDARGFEIIQKEVLGKLAVVSRPRENNDERFVTIESTATRDAAYIMNCLDAAGILNDSPVRKADMPSLAIEAMSTYSEPDQGVVHTVLLFRDTQVQ